MNGEIVYKILMNIRETYVLDGTSMEDEMSDEVQWLLEELKKLKRPNPSPYQNEEVIRFEDIDKLFAEVQKYIRGI